MKLGDRVQLNQFAPQPAREEIHSLGASLAANKFVGTLKTWKFVPGLGLAPFVKWDGVGEATFCPFRYLKVVGR